MIKLVIFDFDGTLVDGKESYLNLIENSLDKNGYSFDQKILRKQLGDTTLDGTLRLFGVSEGKIFNLIDEIKKLFLKETRSIGLAENIEKIEEIKEKKIIVSNNFREVIVKIIKENKLDFFSEVYEVDMGQKKSSKIKEIIKKEGIKKEEVLYIGDKPVDKKVADEVGCLSVIVTNSFSFGKEEDIIKSNPDFLIKNLSEIKKIIDKLNGK